MIFKRTLAAVLITIGIVTILFTLRDSQTQSTTPVSTIVSQPVTPTNTPHKRIYSGSISYEEEKKRTLESVATASTLLSTIHPEWYRITNNDDLEILKTLHKKELAQIATEGTIRIIPTIRNTVDTLKTAQLFTSRDKQQAFITTLVTLAQQENYDGFTIHWERIDPSHGEDFTAFIASLHQALKQKNKLLYVTVSPRTGKPGDTQDARTFDFVSLSKVCDFILIDAMNYHNNQSMPGPVTPMNWYIDVITYAKTSIPLQQLIIKLPTFGYIWTDNKATLYQYQDISTILQKNNIVPLRDSLSFALSATYNTTSKHVAWYEDTNSLLAKIEKAELLGIYQFNISYLGGEDPTIWSRL